VTRCKLPALYGAGIAELVRDLWLERVEVLAVAVLNSIPDWHPPGTRDALQFQRQVGVKIDTSEDFPGGPSVNLSHFHVEYRAVGTDGNRV
jgi:hypothetical protein